MVQRNYFISSFNFATTISISSLVLYLEKENLTAERVGSDLIPVSTCEPTFEPEEQALPPDTEIPAMSKLNNNISPISLGGKETFKTVYKLFSGSISPLNAMFGIAAFNDSII